MVSEGWACVAPPGDKLAGPSSAPASCYSQPWNIEQGPALATGGWGRGESNAAFTLWDSAAGNGKVLAGPSLGALDMLRDKAVLLPVQPSSLGTSRPQLLLLRTLMAAMDSDLLSWILGSLPCDSWLSRGSQAAGGFRRQQKGAWTQQWWLQVPGSQSAAPRTGWALGRPSAEETGGLSQSALGSQVAAKRGRMLQQGGARPPAFWVRAWVGHLAAPETCAQKAAGQPLSSRAAVRDRSRHCHGTSSSIPVPHGQNTSQPIRMQTGRRDLCSLASLPQLCVLVGGE